MKKFSIMFLAMFCLLIIAKAQIAIPLKVGDTVPEAIWNMPLEVVNHSEGKQTITLNDYAGKLIILDFWDKYCGSCISAMPKMAELQKKFKQEMVIINVTRDSPVDAMNCLTTNKMIKSLNLFSVVADSILNKTFPHLTIPHYIWINSNRNYISQSVSSFVSAENINKILIGITPNWQEKNDINMNKPLFLGNQVPLDVNLGGYSIFIKGYVSGLTNGAGMPTLSKFENLLNCYYSNHPILKIYRSLAYKAYPAIVSSTSDTRLIIESDSIGIFSDSSEVFTFQYMTAKDQTDSLYTKALAVLNSMTGYKSKIEQRRRKHYQLVRTSQDDKIKSKGGEVIQQVKDGILTLNNQPFSVFIKWLKRVRNLKTILSEMPLVDATDYRNNIDISIKYPVNSVFSLNQTLEEYGLNIELVDKAIDVVVISPK